ncbi:MAG: ABC transporter ATP-binding protein [Treponema sp.]|nr:ABC transporter ATP-binding protein [Treponema sp.]
MLLAGVEKKLGAFSLSVERFAVSKPGIYGLIGPNGSGKTTLARIMTGLLEPDNGTTDTEGLGFRDITILDRKPYMMDDTVYNNLVYPLKLRNIQPDPERIAVFLDKMGFSQRGRQRAKSLSGGEQQKLALLRAIIFKPRFIIADEAMTALDIDSLDLFEQTILEEQKNENSTWIIISHQMPHIRRLCGYIYFMYDGRMETQGSAEEIFSRAVNPHLRQYLRSYADIRPGAGE